MYHLYTKRDECQMDDFFSNLGHHVRIPHVLSQDTLYIQLAQKLENYEDINVHFRLLEVHCVSILLWGFGSLNC